MTALAAPRLRRVMPATTSGRIGLGLLVAVVAVALLGPLLAGNDPNATVGTPFAPPGSGALLGTDELGRDVLARTLYGGRTVLLYSAIATALAYLGGLTIGLLSGYLRGWTDSVLMRAVDVLLSFPALVFILLVSVGLGRGITAVVIATAVVQLPAIARIIRTATLEQSVRGFVEAAVARGERTVSIMRREIMPNIARTIAADLGLRFTWSVLLIASVNFLGLGLQPPATDWGLMVSENRAGIGPNPASVLLPALMLGLLTISINLLGDSLSGDRR